MDEQNWNDRYPEYGGWEKWNEEDFEKYQRWCKWNVSRNNFVCRECWHLHCHPNKCTMRNRVQDLYEALVATDIFPKEICELIASKIPDQDTIS